MRTGDASCGADPPDGLTSRHCLAFADPDDRQMRKHGKYPEAVVDHDGVAGEIEIAREQHAPAVRRMDGSPCRTEKISAAVWLPRFAVEKTP